MDFNAEIERLNGLLAQANAAGNQTAYDQIYRDIQHLVAQRDGKAYNPTTARPVRPTNRPNRGDVSEARGRPGDKFEITAPYTAPDNVKMTPPKGAYGLNDRQQALLDAIAGKESRGRYNIGFGGTTIKDLSWHPGQSLKRRIERGPNAGKTSSAAGRYQFMEKDWNEWAKKAGVNDFSPRSQDRAALAMARETYKAKTGRDLDSDLMSDDPKVYGKIGRALSGRWTSLPGGIEATQTEQGFAKAIQDSLSGNPSVEGSGNAAGATNPVTGAYMGRQPIQATPAPEYPQMAAPIGAQAYPGSGIQQPQAPAGSNANLPAPTPEEPIEGMFKKDPRTWTMSDIGKITQLRQMLGGGKPIIDTMGHARAGMAGLENPGFQDMSGAAMNGMQGLMGILMNLSRLGGK